MKKYDVIAIGELNVDIILTGLKSLPELGKEIISETFSIVLGSSTAICASGLAKLGLKTSFIGKTGEDMFADIVTENLDKNGIDTSNLIIDTSINTGATIALNKGNDRALVTYLGSIEALTFEDIDKELLKETRHIHIGSFFLQHNLRPKLKELFEYAHSIGVTTSLDAGWDDTNTWDFGIWEVLKYTDIFFPNEGEAVNITGEVTTKEAIKKLSSICKNVVVKLGPKGAAGMSNGEYVEVPTFDELKPIDTTGAGDSFNSGFIYGFLNGMSLKNAMVYGNACGSISVTKIGGASSCATIEEVEKLIKD